MKIFLASRFDEFEDLRKIIIQKIQLIHSSIDIKIINLADNKFDVNPPNIRSIKEVEKSDFLLLISGDTYSTDIYDGYSITHWEYITARDSKNTITKLDIEIIPIYVGNRFNEATNTLKNSEIEGLRNLETDAFAKGTNVRSHFSLNSSVKDESFYLKIEKIAEIIINRIIEIYNDFAHEGFLNKSNLRNKKKFLIEPNLNSNPNIEEFYNGIEANWSIFSKNIDISRDIYKIKNGIYFYLNSLDKNTNNFILLRGSSGTGKTTLLKRICFDLHQKQKTYFLNGKYFLKNNIDIIEFINSAQIANNSIVGIDDFLDVLEQQKRVIEDINTSKVITIIYTSHPNLVNNSSLLNKQLSNTKIFNLSKLSYNEINLLINKLEYLENENLLKKVNSRISREKRFKLIEHSLKQELLLSIITLRHAEELNKIIIDEFNNIPSEKGQTSYLFCVISDLISFNISEDVLFSKLNINYWRDQTQIKEIYDSLEGIIIREDDCLKPRHKIFSKNIFNYFYNSKNKKIKIISRLLELNDSISHFDLLKDYFQSSSKVSKTIKRQFKENSGLEIIFDDILNSLKTINNQLYTKNHIDTITSFILGAKGMYFKSIFSYDEAIEVFKQGYSLQETSFYLRQIAWCYLEMNDYTNAINTIIKAVQENDNFLNNLECADIYSLCEDKEDFLKAERHYEIAKNKVTEEKEKIDIEKKLSRYLDAKKVVELFINNSDIPDDAIKILNPNIQTIKSLYGVDHNFFKNRLIHWLSKNQKRYSGDSSFLSDWIDLNPNTMRKNLRAKYYSTMGRYLYVQKYKNLMDIETSKIEEFFTKSISINPKDPFNLTWFATFLKEIKKKYDEAEKYYRKAIELSEKSRYDIEKRHPMLLNNLALLLTEKLERGSMSVNKQEINNLYLEAIANAKDTDFYWAEINFSYFKQINEYE